MSSYDCLERKSYTSNNKLFIGFLKTAADIIKSQQNRYASSALSYPYGK
jgi:hypothetical protein